jgi:metal-responsive CopG/Arc/MetJ family transcriptional regulator
MKAVTIRLEENVITEIEEHRGLKPRADFIRDIIDTYFLKSDSQESAGNSQAHLNEIANLKNDLQHSEIRISDLCNQIDSQKNQMKTLEQQLGFLQLEYQKLTDRLMLPAAKSWWQFWKK